MLRVELHAAVIVERVCLLRLQHLQQPRDALERDVVRRLEHDRRRVSRRMDVVVRRGDEPARRIELARQIRAEAVPLVGAGARHRQPADPRSPALVAAVRFGVSADACHAMLPSTSPQIRFSVGAFQYIAAVEELLAVRRLREPQAAEVRRRARLEQRRSQRVRAMARAVLVEDRTVTAELELDGLAASALSP